MTNAKYLYRLLLRCYPQRFRDEFGEQMMQTFLDQAADLDRSKGASLLNFWWFTVTDEFKNIIQQRISAIVESDLPRRARIAMLALAMTVFLPLFALCYVAVVSVALIVPHPPVSGIGFLVALPLILSAAAGLSGALSVWLAKSLTQLMLRSNLWTA